MFDLESLEVGKVYQRANNPGVRSTFVRRSGDTFVFNEDYAWQYGVAYCPKESLKILHEIKDENL